jgi:hypothetical protein
MGHFGQLRVMYPQVASFLSVKEAPTRETP